jgi:hypothetical protein
MQVRHDEQDRGLGVVNPDVEEWSRARMTDVALLRMELPDEAIGHSHHEEEEIRLRGVIIKFEVIERGENRLAAFPW